MDYPERDENGVAVAVWVDSTDSENTLPILINPDTGAILAET